MPRHPIEEFSLSRLVRLIRQLSVLPVAPYHERAVLACLVRESERAGIEFALDRWGNLVTRYRRGRAAPVTYLAHTDHPGLVTTESHGRRARGRWFGGVRKRYFRKGRVRVSAAGRDYRGIVTSVETDSEDRVTWVRLWMDEPTPPGAVGSWDLAPFRRAGRLIELRGADDLVGCAAILATMITLAEQEATADVHAVFTRAEEDGLNGAFGLGRDQGLPMETPVVVVECSRLLPSAQQGLGPVVRVGDRMSVFDPALTADLAGVASELREKIPHFRYQRALMDGGVCEASALDRFGYRTGGLALSLGNYHNMGESGPAPETIHLDDFRDLYRLLLAFAVRRPGPRKRDLLTDRMRQRFRVAGPRLLATHPFGTGMEGDRDPAILADHRRP